MVEVKAQRGKSHMLNYQEHFQLLSTTTMELLSESGMVPSVHQVFEMLHHTVKVKET